MRLATYSPAADVQPSAARRIETEYLTLYLLLQAEYSLMITNLNFNVHPRLIPNVCPSSSYGNRLRSRRQPNEGWQGLGLEALPPLYKFAD